MKSLADQMRDSLDLIGEGDWTPQDILAARLAAAYDEQAALIEIMRAREWRLMPDDPPVKYLGRKQPGAAPMHYGPDDVVVDGDWLADLESRHANSERKLEAIRDMISKARFAGLDNPVGWTKADDTWTKWLISVIGDK